MDIHSKSGYPASALSNFAPHPFVFDGVPCASMEGLLQSFKFNKPHIQVEICKLVGIRAKSRGAQRSWRRYQKLYWKGIAFDRHSKAYQGLLTAAFGALFEQSESFRRALAATGNAVLTHSIGRTNPSETILTQSEFCSRLTYFREQLKNSA